MNESEPRAVDALQRTAALIRDYREGDHSAFSTLYALHHECVLRSVARGLGRHLRDIVGPEDVLQEAFQRVSVELQRRSPDEFRTVGHFRYLLAKIARQIVIDCARLAGADKRDWRRRESLAREHEALRSQDPRPSQVAGAHAMAEIFEEAMLRLSPDHRTVIDLRELGMEYNEIAEAMKLTNAASAKLRFSRAQRRLRALLDPHVSGD